MPTISSKGAAMPASPIRKLVPYALAAKRRGTHIYHLNIGQPDVETPASVRDAWTNYDKHVLAYIQSEGTETYREKLSGYYERTGLTVDPNEIVVTTGGSEALLFGLMSCLDAGDELIVPEPFYANYNGFARAGDIRIVPVPTRIEDGFALPAIDDFEDLITDRTKAILICNPNNPTGYLYSQEEMDVLSRIVREHDLFLFADEVYREFAYDGKTHISLLTYDELADHAVVIDSISKRYSACGARLGALVTRNEAVRAAAVKFAQTRLSPPTLSEAVAEAALDLPQSYFDEVVEEYGDRRRVLLQELETMEGVVCPTPGGAFYAMAELPVDDAERFCQWMLESFERDGKTVMMAPGAGFYATPGQGTRQVRIAYVLNEGDMRAAMACLRDGLVQYRAEVMGLTG
mgnify:CR=1 FL=1